MTLVYTLAIGGIGKSDFNLVGGKGFHLGELAKLKMPVPTGFVVTTRAFDKFLEENGMKARIDDIINRCDVDSVEKLLEASDKIKKMILSGKIPDDAKKEIANEYRSLSFPDYQKQDPKIMEIIGAGRDLAVVAVRSSGVAEDLPQYSFAGQHASFLNVVGTEELLNSIRECWASLFESRAIFYRAKNKIQSASIAVVVQRMVNSEKSGVMFTVNPSTGENNIVIEATWGLGESLVQGQVEPDKYVISKDGRTIDKKIGKKNRMTIKDIATNSTTETAVPKEKVSMQVLNENELAKLMQYALDIEKFYNHPQDIEFAIERNKIFLVQTRNITTEAKEKEEFEVEEKPIVKGLAASPGIAVGKVKIVNSVEQLVKIGQGDILVTRMTSPDYVVAMAKSVAIITDEGGMTCIGGDAKILTDKGLFAMNKVYELVKRGENLHTISLDPNSMKVIWKRIVGAKKQKANACLIEVFNHTSQRKNKDTLVITGNHEVVVFEDRNLVKKHLEELIGSDESLLTINKIPYLPPRIGSMANDIWYLSGAIFSDGSINYRNRQPIGFRFSQKDEGPRSIFLNHVINQFNETFGITMKDVSSHEMAQFSPRVNEYSVNRKFPAVVFDGIKNNLAENIIHLDDTSLASFLAGSIDGDGHKNKQKSWIEIYVNKKDTDFAEGIVVSCLRLGMLPRVTKKTSVYEIVLPKSDKLLDILKFAKRIDSGIGLRTEDTKLFSSKQLLLDVWKDYDWRGTLWSYIKRNSMIGINKAISYLDGRADIKLLEELQKIRNSDVKSIRFKMTDLLKQHEVYDLCIESDNEMGHNFIVFTSMYTPIVVGNSHASIVSREMGIPCIVGSRNATKMLKDNDMITVDAYKGFVYSGKVELMEEEKKKYEYKETKAKIYMNLAVPEKVDDYKNLPFDGIGLMRVEFIIASYIKEHPNYLIEIGQAQKYIDRLAEGIAKIAGVVNPRPVVVRFSDFKTNEYRELKGGEKFEPIENNPMIGWRGVSRYISPEFEKAFRLECKAISKVRVEMRLKNVWVMLPFVRTTWEVEKCLSIMKSEGLERSKDLKVWLMAEVPSIIWMADEFSKLCDGFSIGSNDLTQLTLGVDRDSGLLAKMGYFDERNEAVKRSMAHLITAAHENGVTVSICGQSVSVYPEITEFLIRTGIDSVSINPDTVEKTRYLVANIEEKLK